MNNPLEDLGIDLPEAPVVNEELTQWADDLVQRLSVIISALAEGSILTYHVAPTKVWDGRLVIADGTDWNPGSGQGVYCYYNSTWNKL